MARGGPPLTKPFDINPIRGHALPARGRQRFGGRAGSTITVPGTNPSPDPKEEPLKQGKTRGGTGVKFLGCSSNSKTSACSCKLRGRPRSRSPPGHCANGGAGCARLADELLKLQRFGLEADRLFAPQRAPPAVL